MVIAIQRERKRTQCASLHASQLYDSLIHKMHVTHARERIMLVDVTLLMLDQSDEAKSDTSLNCKKMQRHAER